MHNKKKSYKKAIKISKEKVKLKYNHSNHFIQLTNQQSLFAIRNISNVYTIPG